MGLPAWWPTMRPSWFPARASRTSSSIARGSAPWLASAGPPTGWPPSTSRSTARRRQTASSPPNPGSRDRHGDTYADSRRGQRAARLRRPDAAPGVDGHREAGPQAGEPLRRDRTPGRHLAPRRARPGRLLRGHALLEQLEAERRRRTAGGALYPGQLRIHLADRPDGHLDDVRRPLRRPGELRPPAARPADGRPVRRAAHLDQLPRARGGLLGRIRVRGRLRRSVRGAWRAPPRAWDLLPAPCHERSRRLRLP